MFEMFESPYLGSIHARIWFITEDFLDVLETVSITDGGARRLTYSYHLMVDGNCVQRWDQSPGDIPKLYEHINRPAPTFDKSHIPSDMVSLKAAVEQCWELIGDVREGEWPSSRLGYVDELVQFLAVGTGAGLGAWFTVRLTDRSYRRRALEAAHANLYVALDDLYSRWDEARRPVAIVGQPGNLGPWPILPVLQWATVLRVQSTDRRHGAVREAGEGLIELFGSLPGPHQWTPADWNSIADAVNVVGQALFGREGLRVHFGLNPHESPST